MVIVRRYTHHFLVITNDKYIRDHLNAFCRAYLITYKFSMGKNKGVREVDKVFAGSNKARTHYRFLISCWDIFCWFMNNRRVNMAEWDIQDEPMYKPAKASFKCIFPHPLRPKQVEIKDFITAINPETNTYYPTRVIPLQMGGGKTLSALYVAAMIGQRTIIEVSKRYMNNWLSNIYGEDAKLDVTEKETLVITSIKELLKAVKKSKSRFERFNPKIIVVHKTVMNAFIDAYSREEPIFKQFGCRVEDIYKVLGIGLVIRDEVHEEIYINAKGDFHRHAPLVINLSATLEFDDPKLNELCTRVFTMENRFNAGEWNRYIDVEAKLYRLRQPTKLKWSLFKGGPYSQVQYEKTILKNRDAKTNFFNLVSRLIKDEFVDIMNSGEKILVYAHTILMCTNLADHLEKVFNGLKVNRYVGEDDYSQLLSGDIVVTTPGSAGTGVDIKNLRRVIMTNAIKSSQKNYQIAGRLRELENRDTKFIYLVNSDIDQHLIYHNFKKEKFFGKMKSHITTDTYSSI